MKQTEKSTGASTVKTRAPKKKETPKGENEILSEAIVEAIREKKGKGIAIIDLREVSGAISKYYIVCEGSSPTQVEAIGTNIIRSLREEFRERPLAHDGFANAQWIAIDYGTVMVHTFVPELRDFYRIEQLWHDVPIEYLEDED